MMKKKALQAETWKEYHKNNDTAGWLLFLMQTATLLCGMGLGVLVYLDGLDTKALGLVAAGYVALVCSVLGIVLLRGLGVFRYPNCERCGASVPQSTKEIQLREQLIQEQT